MQKSKQIFYSFIHFFICLLISLLLHLLPYKLPSYGIVEELNFVSGQYLSVFFIKRFPGNSLVVQWLRLSASTAGGAGLIPGWGTKVPHASAAWPK